MPRPSEGLPETQVENILAANCGQCHGPALRPEQASGDIWFIDDVDQLTERGYIVPLNSAASRIVQVMRDGSMPPADSGLPPLDESDIEIVARFIDEPRFWPVPPRPQPPEAIDEFGLFYYSDGTVRGADLAPLFRYQPGNRLPAVYE